MKYIFSKRAVDYFVLLLLTLLREIRIYVAVIACHIYIILAFAVDYSSQRGTVYVS